MRSAEVTGAKIEIRDSVLNRVTINIHGDTLKVDIPEEVSKGRHYKEMLGNIFKPAGTVVEPKKEGGISLLIPLSKMRKSDLQALRTKLQDVLKTIKTLKIELEAKYTSREKELNLFKNHVERLKRNKPSSDEIPITLAKIQAINNYNSSAEELGRLQEKMTDLLHVVTQLSELMDYEKDFENVKVEMSRVIGEALQLSYETDQVIKR